MASRFETDLWRSTYREDFACSPSSFLPPLKYFQEPCLYPQKGKKLSPRVFPISLPRFPHRRRDGEIPMASGFETLPHRMEQVRQGITNPLTRSTPAAYLHSPTPSQQPSVDASARSMNVSSSLAEHDVTPSFESFRGSPALTTAGREGTPSNLSKADTFIKKPRVSSKDGSIEPRTGVPDQVFEEIVKLSIYTPSSQLSDLRPRPPSRRTARKISAKFLDTAVREKHPDTVRNRALRYEKRPEPWQRVGTVWDKVQNRPGCDEKTENETLQTTVCEMDKKRVSPFVSSVQPSNTLHSNSANKQGGSAQQQQARLLQRDRVGSGSGSGSPRVKIREEQLTRIPGYGGYMPALPHTTDSRPGPALTSAEAHSGNVMQSMAQLTFRNHPPACYQAPPAFGHPGPLSKTVTLTQPFNPFNKIDRQNIVCC